MTGEQLRDRIAGSESVTLTSSLDHFSEVEIPSDAVSLETLSGVVEFSPADQVVVVRSGTLLSDLNNELSQAGHTIPHLFPPRCLLPDAPLHALVDYNLPHLLEAQCGAWRDWVLGMRVILADGTECKCGSKAVKNVAGYDVQKLFIGARASLGVITELTLKTFPLRAMPSSVAEYGDVSADGTVTIHRTLRNRFAALREELGSRLICRDSETATLWGALAPNEGLSRIADDWVIRAGCGRANLGVFSAAQSEFMVRAKQLIEPTHKL